MNEATDIREWAKGKGIEIGERGRIPAEVRDQFAAEQAALAGADETIDVPDLGETPPFNGQAPPGGSSRGPRGSSGTAKSSADETAPKPPEGKRRFWQREPRADEPRKHTRRISLERWTRPIWEGIALFAAANVSAPTGACMKFQAPVAGMILDDMIKDTLVDRMVQPLAQMAEGTSEAWGLIGPPMCVFILEQRPEAAPVVYPMLVNAVKSYLVTAGPLLAKARAREKKAIEALAQMSEGEDAALDVESLIAEWFGTVMAQPEPQTAAA